MPTNQPDWRCVGTIGDVNPIDHGGGFVFVDDSGVYPPELEWIEPPDESGWRGGFGPRAVYRVILDRCTFIDGILSDNKYHPECAAWFAEALLAPRFDCDDHDLIADITSADPMQRAFAYWNFARNEGWENLDSEPLKLRLREIRKRLDDPRYTIRPEPPFTLESAFRDDPAFLFELRVKPHRDRSTIIVRAWEAGFQAPNHTRLDVEVRQDGEVIFPRGSLWCGIPLHQSIDGIDAKECVLGLVGMKPGDTEREYFGSYTQEQLDWAEEFGEALSWERESRYCEPETGSVKSRR